MAAWLMASEEIDALFWGPPFEATLSSHPAEGAPAHANAV
jgi:hypothetical protein